MPTHNQRSRLLIHIWPPQRPQNTHPTVHALHALFSPFPCRYRTSSCNSWGRSSKITIDTFLLWCQHPLSYSPRCPLTLCTLVDMPLSSAMTEQTPARWESKWWMQPLSHPSPLKSFDGFALSLSSVHLTPKFQHWFPSVHHFSSHPPRFPCASLRPPL